MKDTKENRIKFLKENGAYDGFTRNWECLRGEPFDEEWVERSMRHSHFINSAFSWSLTSEGEDYWHNLHDKWNMKISKE